MKVSASPYPLEPLDSDRSLVLVKRKLPIATGNRMNHSTDIDRTASPKPTIPAVDLRQMSPRKMVKLSLDLHVAGIIGWEEHVMPSFQADLHPDYSKTIGALTGEPAKPDHPKDFIEEWERRLAFQRRYNPGNVRRIRRTEHIKNIFNQIDAPTHLVA